MQVLGMDPKKEDWSSWTVNIRAEEMRKKISEFNPSLAEYFKTIWE
jgi:hypothetical protein